MSGQRATIYAPATAPGRAGIAVVRISGPAADAVLAALTGGPLPAPRRAALRRLRDGAGGLLDEALVLRLAAGASFTGEAMVELHCHGGLAVLRAVLAAVAAVPGTRLAEPGEFTLRAFEAGRMDLAEVEALGDLIAAETEAQRAQAVRQLGGLSRLAEGWRGALVRALALTEAVIDWADEEVPERVEPEVGTLLGGVVAEIDRALAVSEGAERLRQGFEVAILGAPNAGKSSLLNALAGREAAITSPMPGTTRDVVELRYDLEGLPVVFLDMAGLRPTADPVEAIGVARATARAEAAALRLLLAAPDAPLPREALALERPGDLRLASKADLGGAAAGLAVSATTGAGLRALLGAIAARLGERVPSEGLVAHERQRLALEAARNALAQAAEGLDFRPPELISEDIRTGLRALERLIGRVDTEEVLGEVFARFCLGK
ncbi:tRNA uridine-5-carboxymethylaminomethyl(34) synthesis GTPase MnmE [Paralimibaculum aggregatum]|uniref:tRNA modification GTPase MnmE n=1 Tax=Paralimibaculum aggregatum TaxID=3036245 RepID=A0ABQ6LSC8_9RHOB|nr:tRNA uridine-5-carboxymethylaminomethyl(34) synthesis GTPase MnmE [Limibaculum sp. NKW23]GMG84984.1 tRNA uridine-5-carboxymethylaminomethyl(34) synthesis GTPase MnmE [Limibaculum sp. NKW23]